MTAQKGRDYLVQLETAPNVFTSIGGMREPTITINNEPVDITDADSDGFRRLLEGAGVTSVSIKAQGVYVDNEYQGTLRDAALANTHLSLRFVIPGSVSDGNYDGDFMVASFEEAGPHNSNGTYNVTFENADLVTFA